ncbi:hypothetical protein ACVWWG_001406 [Bradyrhizobium sp. LB7.2]
MTYLQSGSEIMARTRLVLDRGALMTRKLPPLNALRVFETAARSENFTQAAKRLNVS